MPDVCAPVKVESWPELESANAAEDVSREKRHKEKKKKKDKHREREREDADEVNGVASGKKHKNKHKEKKKHKDVDDEVKPPIRFELFLEWPLDRYQDISPSAVSPTVL
jgi:hypothetical protein